MADEAQPQTQISIAAIAQALGERDFRILVLETEVARLTATIATMSAGVPLRDLISGGLKEVVP